MRSVDASNLRCHESAAGFPRLRLLGLLGVLTLGSAPLAETTSYEYDALGRLVNVTKDDGTEIDYNYDPAGNRESRVVSDGSPPPNNPPVAVSDWADPPLYQSQVVNVVANDSDPDGDPLTVISTTQPWNATVQIVSATNLNIIGMAVGTGTFSYTISDGNGGTASTTVNVYVQSGGW